MPSSTATGGGGLCGATGARCARPRLSIACRFARIAAADSAIRDTVVSHHYQVNGDLVGKSGEALTPVPTPDPASAALMEQAIGADYDAQYVKALDHFAQAARREAGHGVRGF